MPPMHPLDTHVSRHRVGLSDCDMFGEMNNGRILTMYEMGRFQASMRMGLLKLLRQNKWAFAVAGTSIRYRRRLVPFERYEMRSRVVTWDERFVYIEQGMFKMDGECASHVLFRTAVTAKRRAIPTDELVAALGIEGPRPTPAPWIQNWIDAEATRVWPPEI